MAGQPIYRAFKARMADPEMEAVVIERIAAGDYITHIARDLGVSYHTLRKWFKEDPERLAAVTDAKEASADVHAEKGLKVLEAADPGEPGGVRKAAKIAEYRKYLAKVRNRAEYGDGPEVAVAIGMGESFVAALRSDGRMSTVALEGPEESEDRALPPATDE